MTRIKLAIFSTLLAMGLHAYLAWTFYPLKYAQSSGESICNINATFNCDTVAASPFSSLFNVPMAVWGLSTNFIFLVLLLIYAFRLTDERERALRNSFYLAFFIALVSIIMGSISIIMINSVCLFCIGAYLCSFVSLIALWGLTPTSVAQWTQDTKELLSKNKNFLFLLAAIPIISFLAHSSMEQQYGGSQLKRVIKSSIAEWSQNPVNNLNVAPSLSYGPARDQAKLVLSEFADFLCGHCKHAAPSLESFAKSHPDVRLEFYSFALDGDCNEAISRKVGAPCVLAKATYCASKVNKGWEIHDVIFHNQTEFYEARSIEMATEKLKSLSSNLVDDWQSLKDCIDSDEALNHIKAQAKLGDESGVKGTPTIYANGKKLPRGQLMDVLKSLYKTLK
ncbi:MAG: thioredoxin domain-containing protein [Bdellovibrionales bacterium]|nr:thioredoxin domain-containing protein [Bdellovibrionales bacterium]